MNQLNQLFLRDSKAFRRVVLTKFSTKILKIVLEHKLTTVKELATFCEIPYCTAGVQMKKFSDAGYLTRKLDRGRINRGEYIYTINKGN